MGEVPTTVTPTPKKGLSTGAILGIVFGSLLFIGVIVVLAVGYLIGKGLREPSAPADAFPAPVPGDEPAPPAGSSDAVNVAGMPVDFVDGTVTTACFTFDLSTDFEMNPDSIGCQIALRPVGYDSLLEIDVMAQSGDNSEAGFFEVMGQLMEENWPDVEYSTETLLVDGRVTPVAHAVNGWGVRADYYQVPVDTGELESDGTPITSILILLPDFSSVSGFDQLADDLIESFTVLD